MQADQTRAPRKTTPTTHLARSVQIHLWPLVPPVLARGAPRRLVLRLQALQQHVVLPLLPLLNNVPQHTLLSQPAWGKEEHSSKRREQRQSEAC
jgi:hypothetical protein